MASSGQGPGLLENLPSTDSPTWRAIWNERQQQRGGEACSGLFWLSREVMGPSHWTSLVLGAAPEAPLHIQVLEPPPSGQENRRRGLE